MAKKKKVEQPEEESWEEETQETDSADAQSDWDETESEDSPPEQEDWDAVPPPSVPLTLPVETHTGEFDPAIAKIMVYGESGSYKTRTGATFPGVLFVDVDHGMASVDTPIDKVYIHDDENGFDELKNVYEFLRQGDHEYETVVLDTLNEMQRVIMRFTLEEFTTVRRSYGSLPGMSDYGYMLNQFMELTRSFISLPMRVVLLAQVNSQQFETDTLMPQLIGKNTSRELARKMDVIGYIYKTQEGDDVIPQITFASTQHVTKDRSNRLPSVLAHPSYERMSAYWK